MALSAAVLLIGKLGAILENERTTIASVRDEIDSIRKELESMKAFLVDAEAYTAKTETEKLWIASIRDLAYEVEDIIDEFMYHMHEKQSGSRLSRRLHKTICFPKSLWFRRKTAKRLQKITKKIKDESERSQRFSVGPVGGATTSEDIHRLVQNQAESSFFSMEDELVGIEGKKQILMGWLMDEDQHQTVISVVGMGGSGKTTLAAKTFNNEGVKRHFHCCAWITVSQTSHDEGHLFRSLIMEFYKSRKEDVPENLNTISRRELIELLVNYLESKKYLVVLDDVWDIKVWREIKVSLQDRQLGSRIIVTTRKEEVAANSFGVKSHVHHIQPLLKNEAWELFCKKAFSSNEHKTCPPDFVSLACQLVEKCEGLPLAIVGLGGLMSSKNSLDQWQQVFNSLNWHMDNNSLLDPVKNILLLSFNDLPSQLKHCFLYCSLFPEDFVIRRKRLIRLWIAEGFFEHVKGITPEEVADGYLWELCFRSMLQVVKRNGTGRPKQVKMHDLMRELALSIAKRENFGHVYDGREGMEEISTRRLSIHTMSNGGEIQPWPGMSKIRSLLIFATDMSSLSFLNTLVSRCNLLRTLDLEDVQIDKLPDAVVYLFNLRYLNLSGTLIKELPKSIGRLRNLQYLKIEETMIEAIPQGIAKLLNLRYLTMFRLTGTTLDFKVASGTKAPSNICQLQKLQCLSMIESEGDTIRLIGNMTQLRVIGISNVKERDEIDLWVSIEKLTLLQSLLLMASNEEEILPVKAQFPSLPHLQKLQLIGRLQNLIPWFSSLHSLTTLVLHWSRLEDDVLPQIEALPNLTELILCEELCFRKGFVKLERLHLLNFASVKKITIEKGVMPNLRDLMVEQCTELSLMPLGLEYLSNLQFMGLAFVPVEVIKPIQKGGADRSKVQHIPEILHVFEQSFKRVYENLA
ncbi:putative P-loop containing nucleoside triphosphate hydrolase, leucine-rich repeat domain, L [Rosa chinensis]|uniref:Putative P-loop containing nucleoside triphosphate hydrolase, leucine-rich repeat domain, L n=1 Tax=Rosa chinensis TaxID=74649 RepID=A0A2P6Q6Q1_ROSCH|nr:disease resistance protein RPM1 [Rosa chinensis]XP_040362398.1 disease resistance protein RPM1 [Rosa chinensis]PRQ29861.1 putative P-loop containing nucleoside triphosphate hydrolase, leucine-rich repeat domain, L [Rosa chinensis]